MAYRKTPGAWGTGAALAKRQAVVDRMRPERREKAEREFESFLPASDLFVGRVLMAAFGFLAAAGLYATGSMAFTPRAGILASLMLLYHPAYLAACQDVGSDVIALAFSTWAMFFLTALVESSSGRSQIVNGTALGVLLAFACGSKMNALVIVLLAASLWLGAIVSRRSAIALSISLFVFPVLFLASDPTLYTDLPGGFNALFEEHRLTLEIQSTFLEGRMRTWTERLPVIVEMVGTSRTWFVAITACAVGWTVSGISGRRSKVLVVVFWWWLTLVALLAWVPFAWARYVLPLVPPSVLVLAMGFDLGARGLRRAVARARRRLRASVSGVLGSPIS
jgi:hypothetical protein